MTAAKSDIAMRAQEILDKTQQTVNRCVEKQIPFPANWADFRQALRDCVSGKIDTLPDYPKDDQGNIIYPA